ncbi:MAG TPA: NAD-dependent epimerase/dehydratase family protein, partial [Gemmatimonadaceae bacterium]
VGSDCNIGKMTAQLQIRDAMHARGERVAFAATGQTGILVEGWGIAVDAVIADFISGAAEGLVLQAATEADIVLVEGQGSIIHPSYSGVTYGLLHGSLPHAMVLCHQPSRKTINKQEWVAIPPLSELVRMHEAVTEPLRPAKVIAIALNTYDLSDEDARAAIAAAEVETGLPVTDPVRYDAATIADAITSFHRHRVG